MTRVQNRVQLWLSAVILGAGLAAFVPATAAAEAARARGSCGASCQLSCCQASGFFCSCYCDTDGHSVCGCAWTY